MKISTVLNLVVILILAAMCIYFIAVPPECVACKERAVVEAKAQADAVIAQQKADSERAAAEALRLAKVQKVKLPMLGHPFDYTGAATGNIAVIPSAALCRSGILVDLDNHKVLWAKNPKLPVPIASMTKIMSSLLVMEAMEQRDFDFNTVIPVSVNASKIGGSQAYIDPKESFTVDELLKAVMVHSANDCTELLGEYVGGSRDAFVAMMNQRAAQMGLRTTKFFNPHGLPPSTRHPTPNDGHNTASPEDMAVMAEYLTQYSKIMEYAAMPTMSFGMNRVKGQLPNLLNSNHRLLSTCAGCDGLKTGFTQSAKYCVTATCKRNGRRLAAVVMGVEHGNRARDDRAKLVRELMDWGYAQK